MEQMVASLNWVCIDTDIIIDYLRGRGEGFEYLEHLLRKFVCCLSSVTTYELYVGAARTGTLNEIDALISRLVILPFNLQASKEAALIYESLRAEGALIGVRDIFTAAICKVYDVPLITRNLPHFSRIKGLKALRITEAIALES